MQKISQNKFFNLCVFSPLREFLFIFSLLFIACTANAQTVTGESAGIPPISAQFDTEPWENPLVNGINRQEARATAYSYNTIEDALSGDRLKSDFILLNGEWDFKFAINPSNAPTDFYKAKVRGWDKIEVPSNWEMKGYDIPI